MILVDSSGWIEYLAARPKADSFAPYIEGTEPLVSSAIQIYEIYKVVRRDVSEERAIAAVSALRTTTIEPLADTLALEAADIALEFGLAMADAIIFATAARHEAEIVTGDADFEGLPKVTLIR
ncbi:MAG: type II toxin-antitoxin system VapC family toxin [Myxococcota bacterium]|nr:type II toxin-antitoxin system VapC family toxin [Myxococcota bacterium]